MKALAERILNHPLKVVKCFHMPKLLAVEKNIFFWNRPGGDFSSMQSSSRWEEPHPEEILRAYLFAPVIEMQQRGDICRFLQFRSK